MIYRITDLLFMKPIFEPHISNKGSLYGYKKENIYHVENMQVKKDITNIIVKEDKSSEMNRDIRSALPDYNNCLVNLSNSILKRFGARTTAGTLSLADKYLEGEYKNVVLLILDALGTSIVERHLEKNGFLYGRRA